MKMAHTCIRVKNLDDSLSFYQKAFGFEEARRQDFPTNKFTLVYLTLPDDDYELELIYKYHQVPRDFGKNFGHFAIHTENLTALHEEHKAAGYNVSSLKELPGVAPFYYFITDPNGYKIKVCC